MAKGFANQGADLVITARRLDKLEEVAKELREEFGIKVLPVQCDVTDTEQVNEAVEKAIAEYGITPYHRLSFAPCTELTIPELINN